jgi:hypothetical protein
VGFVLPPRINFENFTFDVEIDLRDARATNVTFRSCIFKKGFSISGAVFNGDVIFENCTFEAEVNAEGVRFGGEFRWSSRAAGRVSFARSSFERRAKILGIFDGPASFNLVTFLDVTDFVGGWNLFGSAGAKSKPQAPEPRYVFNSTVHLEQIDFRRPDRVQFRMVDLRRAYTTDTDFRKVRFYQTLWYQKKLRRNGLFHEVDAASDPTAAARFAALWEANYRNIRIALEESKDFNAATDFYIGELEWRRRQLPPLRRHFFSIEAMYRYLSNYGGSPLRCVVWLVALLLGYGVFAGAALGKMCWELSRRCAPDPELLARAIAVADVLKVANGIEPLNGWWRIGEAGFRITMLLQIALLVLALRNRIKRG